MAGLSHANDLSTSDREAYLNAKSCLEKAGLSLLPAVQEYAQRHELLGGGSLLGAIKDYVERNKGVRADGEGLSRLVGDVCLSDSL